MVFSRGLRPRLWKRVYAGPMAHMSGNISSQHHKETPRCPLCNSLASLTRLGSGVPRPPHMRIRPGSSCILVILASHFRGRMELPKKSTTWSPAYISETKPHTAVVPYNHRLRRRINLMSWAVGHPPQRPHTPIGGTVIFCVIAVIVITCNYGVITWWISSYIVVPVINKRSTRYPSTPAKRSAG